MSKSLIKGHPYFISKDRADSIRPVLKWIKEGAPRLRERQQASRILREVEGIKDWKQVILTRSEADMLSFITREFPEGVEPERQLTLPLDFKEARETRLDRPPRGFGRTPSGELVELPEPLGTKEVKPKFRTELSEEEEAERAKTLSSPNYVPKPDSYFNKRLKEG